MKNHLIIFSKNRAAQLNLLLDSIIENSNDIFDKVSIIFKADVGFRDAYDIMIYSDYYKLINLHWYKENSLEVGLDFNSILKNVIDETIPFTTFMVDDNILYNKIESTQEEILNTIKEDVICFSLRLGENCTYSHPANQNYSLKNYVSYDNFIFFNWNTQEPGDFAYPLSVDGHIYKTKFIKSAFDAIPFNNPNTLEANLQHLLRYIPYKVYSLKESVLVGVPVNLVNDSFNNRNGLKYPISVETLNEKFLNGERINLNALNFSDINGPHKEIKYNFKNENNQ
jgi:hypothetical protein